MKGERERETDAGQPLLWQKGGAKGRTCLGGPSSFASSNNCTPRRHRQQMQLQPKCFRNTCAVSSCKLCAWTFWHPGTTAAHNRRRLAQPRNAQWAQEGCASHGRNHMQHCGERHIER